MPLLQSAFSLTVAKFFAESTDTAIENEQAFMLNNRSCYKLTNPSPDFALEKTCKRCHLGDIQDGSIKVRSMNLRRTGTAAQVARVITSLERAE
jgi:hypothetical protein